MKVVLVTGTTSGFGHLIAGRLHALGHRVYGTCLPDFDGGGDRSAHPLLELDVTRDDSVERCVGEVMSREGRIDVLVNNAGVSIAGALEDTALDEAHFQMEVNFFGPLRMIRAVMPLMRARGSGRILTVGSMAGHVGLPYQPIYCAAKHALEGVNEAFRLELAGSGIDASIICPGDFNTGLTAARVYVRNARSAVHAAQIDITMGIAERDERDGPGPGRVADLVVRLVDAPRLKVRYFVGSPGQRGSIFLKRLLPASLFERMVRSAYQIPSR